MKNQLLQIVLPLHSRIIENYSFAGVVALFILSAVWRGNTPHSQVCVGKVEEAEINLVKDSLPKGKRIELLPRDGSNYSYLFAFYDSTGNIVKKATDKQLQSYSNYSALDFPKLKELKGEPVKVGEGELIYYNLRGIPFAQRKKKLIEANVIGVPDSVIVRANYISSLFGGSVKSFYEGDNYIITTSYSRFIDGVGGQYSYNPFFDQTCISLFDYTGNPIFKIDVNYFVTDAIVSEDGRFLLMFSVKGDFETHDLPLLIHDFKTNSTDTIDLTEEYIDGIMPLDMIYRDSFFQIIGDASIHLLINPYKKEFYIKSYKPQNIYFPGKGGRQFKSFFLPNNTKVSLEGYQFKSY
jgi:hypothetical protein